MSDIEKLKELELALLNAHGRFDNSALVGLYKQAGEIEEKMGDIDAACFYYTHAYVFGLETGHVDAKTLLGKLVEHGRDAYPLREG